MPVSLSGWVRENWRICREHGWRAVPRSLYYAYLGCWFTASSRLSLGENVLAKDWDVLLILDACRVDALEAVAPEYSFIETVGSITSVGSSSEEWLANTFTPEYRDTISGAAYLSANGYTEELFKQGKEPPSRVSVPIAAPFWDIVDEEDFGLLEQVWEYGRDDQLNQVPPRTLTDRTIQIGRDEDFDRIITHYLHPHEPYTGRAWRENREPTEVEANWRDAYYRGDLTDGDVWELYLDNLRFVLDDIELLLENLDAETVVISADHGELLGEWRAHGHPSGVPHPKLRRVPWVEVSASDEGTYEPETISQEATVEVEEHLEALGYM